MFGLCSVTAMMNRREVDRDHQSADMSNSRSSLEAATEAAQRINALLIAKGMLKPSQVSSVPHKTKQQVLTWIGLLLHCTLSLAAQCILIGPVFLSVFACLWVCLFVGLLPR